MISRGDGASRRDAFHLSPPARRRPDAAPSADLWWVLALRGGVAIALGMIALLWPITALITLIFVFAAYNVVEGLFSVILALRAARNRERWWWSALHGAVALVTAAAVVTFPDITILIFVALLMGWGLINGILSLVAALWFKRSPGRGWLVASGFASLLLTALLIAWPPVGLFTLAWMFAFYALAAGVSMLGLALRLRWMDPSRGDEQV